MGRPSPSPWIDHGGWSLGHYHRTASPSCISTPKPPGPSCRIYSFEITPHRLPGSPVPTSVSFCLFCTPLSLIRAICETTGLKLFVGTWKAHQ